MKADLLRQQALEILVAVYGGAALDPLLESALTSLPDKRQAGFLAELVRGTLQWRGRYHHLLAHFVQRRLPQQIPLQALLHMALHQMLALDGVPVYAVVHQAGELCRSTVGKGKVGFVNGVLQSVNRQLLGGDPAGREQRMRALFADLAPDPVAHLAAWQSHPPWLVRRWVENFGLKPAQEICAFNNLPVRLAFHVLPPVDPVQAAGQLFEIGLKVEPGDHPRTLWAQERPSRALIASALEQENGLLVQDAAVQQATAWLVATASRQIPAGLISRGVLDMCAAPGGKTGVLAATWPGSGPVLAMDNRPGRIKLLENTTRRLAHPRIRVLAGDGLRAPWPAGSLGAVLLDGPCSGTGVLRHHPDGRWLLDKKVPARNGRILRKLAHAALDLLAPGGVLMYATCSLEPQENERVLDKLLTERDDVLTVADHHGHWQRQWLPGESGGDGFFAACLAKKD